AGVPVLALDPKGDLTNLLLQFPGLTPEEFSPWVPGHDDAASVATTWRDGLAGWGLGPDQVRAQHESHHATVYTPGSTSGVPLNLFGSLQAPSSTDMEVRADEAEAIVSGLLGLVGIDADPLAD